MNIFTNVFINKRRNALQKILISLVLLVVLIGILNIFQAEIRNCFYFLSYPIEKTLWKAAGSASVFFASILNAENLAEEKKEVKEEEKHVEEEEKHVEKEEEHIEDEEKEL